jgi:glycosyltransferase involved in cell wall biosynthesis
VNGCGALAASLIAQTGKRVSAARPAKIGIFTAELTMPSGSSRKACVLAERLSRRYEVWLISRDRPNVDSLRRSFGVGLAGVRFLCVDAPAAHRVSVWTALQSFAPARARPILEQCRAYQNLRDLDLDLFILNTGLNSYMKPPAPRAIFMCMFPWPLPTFPVGRRYRLPLVRPCVDHVLANTLNRFPDVPGSYDVITANSQFTASWIKRRWNRNARVIYSATQLATEPAPDRKENIILTIGRYNSDKQQHVLIEEFRQMTELHAAGWELHLAGKIPPGEPSYHERLRSLARGYPVVFHYDPSLEELCTLYRRAAIYWHAKGYGVPEDAPQWMEHFGNTPLEAMSAGCVPVVIDAGGLRETVQHGVNGFRWRTLDEMHEQTLRLVRDADLLRRLGARGRQIDPRFGVRPFLAAVEGIIGELLAERN